MSTQFERRGSYTPDRAEQDKQTEGKKIVLYPDFQVFNPPYVRDKFSYVSRETTITQAHHS